MGRKRTTRERSGRKEAAAVSFEERLFDPRTLYLSVVALHSGHQG